MSEEEGIPSGGLVASEGKNEEDATLKKEIARSLDETEARIALLGKTKPDELQSWQKAREIVETFKPVPWFIWRLSNFVFNRTSTSKTVPEGMVLGLRRLLFASASDQILGAGKPINSIKTALMHLSGDVIGGVSVMHGICRRLSGKPQERMWRPILDDALLRAQLGYFVGERRSNFGAGRGMLAGFAGRAGLAVLLASGDEKSASAALERFALGEPIGKVGLEIYGCDPLQVSALLLSASGCGRDAGYGTVCFVARYGLDSLENELQKQWFGTFSIVEKVRGGDSQNIDEEPWKLMGYTEILPRDDLTETTKTLVRSGAAWQWLK